MSLLTDLFILPATVISRFRYAGWRRGPRLLTLARALLGLTGEPFFVPVRGWWQQPELTRLLHARGVKTYGWGTCFGECFFNVPKQQARWAKYLMLRAGVPLLHERGQ